MTILHQAQIDLWDGRVGEKWAAMQVSLDTMLAHATAELTTRVGSVAGLSVLDIGCGTGETCAIWASGGADVTGVDVSTAMLAVAKTRTEGKVQLIKADASQWKSGKLFDLAVSQFGMMFFSDPDTAFSRIAGNIQPGGKLIFSCWRHVSENQWVTLPLGAVRDLLLESPVLTTNAPGPFALADKERLSGILERAGLTNITMTPINFPVCVATEGGAGAAARFVTQIGPAASALADVDKPTKILALERLNVALTPYEKNGCVNLGGAIWLVESVRARCTPTGGFVDAVDG